jgi:hypothetical protein
MERGLLLSPSHLCKLAWPLRYQAQIAKDARSGGAEGDYWALEAEGWVSGA